MKSFQRATFNLVRLLNITKHFVVFVYKRYSDKHKNVIYCYV